MLCKQYKFIQNQWSGRADFPVTTVHACPEDMKGKSCRSRPLIHSSTRTP